jgi:hypothetical protein
MTLWVRIPFTSIIQVSVATLITRVKLLRKNLSYHFHKGLHAVLENLRVFAAVIGFDLHDRNACLLKGLFEAEGFDRVRMAETGPRKDASKIFFVLCMSSGLTSIVMECSYPLSLSIEKILV